ncbi:hypothetical protein Desor_0790 [Desulfosporosinus orientis DSM 765]|uniref:L,D-TPase catalytic domain-containing protein n=1 Tax=Desulfosporosinus orientis (strain ATCC 19365 / DSM 765 / NCIMB 8382 / VKM B-1628 / Singapore I) TaxID=768706 RepID=G7WAC4_DESOD|nr:L,D-transpeptidase [Desulfosporosinus orientis]AET66473.1 hypothetical protein Desor_0790 [Desulfosporosinus orientis DSM 765]
MNTQSASKLKANLVHLNNGYYLSKNDPLFWKKLLQRQSENEEALFHLGLDFKREARNYLEKFYVTKSEKYLVMYHKTIAQALDFVRRSFRKGYIPARLELLRLEQDIQADKNKIAKLNEPSTFSKKQIILLLVVAILISIIVGSLLHFQKSFVTNHHYAYLLPYEVIDHQPEQSLDALNNQSVVIIAEGEKSKENIVNALIMKLKADYEKEPQSAKQVLAFDEKKQELGMAIWEGGDKPIQVFIYPDNSMEMMSNQELQLWEATTVIRSALYQFAKKNGHLPTNLELLCQSYPNNYLSELPKEPFYLKNTVTAFPTKDGGWLFSFKESTPEKDLISLVKDSLMPNLSYAEDIPFQPLAISINKTNNTLSLVSENRIIRKYEASLGKDDATPEGTLLISRKIMNPDNYVPPKDNVYGTRAMELSNLNYAIHGTNHPAEIGKNISHGCIRLKNSDMEELYALVPLNTPVEISKKPSFLISSDTGYYVPNGDLYKYSDNPLEEDPFTEYHWAQ